MEHGSNGYTNSQQRIGKMTGGHGNKRTSGDNSNYSINEIGQNTEESPRDLRRFVDTQTNGYVKNSQVIKIIIITGIKDIQWRYRNVIWHRKICHANNEKRKE